MGRDEGGDPVLDPRNSLRDAGGQHAEDPVTETSVIGVGASGFAAARLALQQGEKVYVSDSRTDAAARAAGHQLGALGAHVDLGDHDVDRIAESRLVVVSPGIPPDAPVLRALRARGVRWISEMELAFRFLDGPLIAITGTNGKTTTTMLTARLLEHAGFRVALGGNVGTSLGPAASELALLDTPPQWYVLEASSFQLADIEQFRPDVGVVTNLAPDHLDRYATIEDYYADKARLFDNGDARSRWVLNADDADVLALAGDAPGRRYHFSLEKPVEGAYLEGDTLVLALDGAREPLLSERELPLLGRHNVANALAAATAAALAGATPSAIADGLRGAGALPHRLQPVVERDGVLWVNDSKATNVAATISALRSLSRPLVLLLGGKDKGEDLAPLREAISGASAARLPEGVPSAPPAVTPDVMPTAALGRIRNVIAYGAAGPRFADALAAAAPVVLVTGTFEDALANAKKVAQSGDIVLLSPGCSSFDQFENYEQRGSTFARWAEEKA
jgi:UDP-N-acetylmuramoylalanine--D-glutamate ligase